MKIQHNVSLQTANTFGINVTARRFVEVTTVKELQEIVSKYQAEELFVLGGGSNLLLTKDIDKLVVQIKLRGISEEFMDDDLVRVTAMAGENWHEFVLYCVNKDFGGLENMSLIPGNVGTAPIQNIGAYGVELKDVFYSCQALLIEDGSKHTFLAADCYFGYRDSIFKNKEKGRFIITSVTFTLSRKQHTINDSYGAIKEVLTSQQIEDPTIQDISKAVVAIRQSKLPDPKVLGNSGSFFKNPIVEKEVYLALREEHPSIPGYEQEDGSMKVAAGWLIEKAGFKGKKFGAAGVHTNQALVLVNHGGATGAEIYALARRIQDRVKEIFGITIEPEVNVI